MKKLSAIVIISGILLTIFSCKTLKKIDVGDVTDIASNVPTDSVTNAVAGEVDFKKGEVLCATGDSSMTANYYQVAKVLTPASPTTKNQTG